MSFQAKNEAVLNQQLKVQEVRVTTAQSNILVASGSDYIVQIGEAVASVMDAIKHPAAGGNASCQAFANLSIVDSTAFTAGGDAKAIKIASLTLAANDVVAVHYATQK